MSSSPPKPKLAIEPAPVKAITTATEEEESIKLEFNGDSVSLYDKLGPTVVNIDGVSLLLSS